MKLSIIIEPNGQDLSSLKSNKDIEVINIKGKTRNESWQKGLAKAKGEFVWLIDCNSTINLDQIDKVLNNLNADVNVFAFKLIRDTTKIQKPGNPYKVAYINPIANKIVRKSLISSTFFKSGNMHYAGSFLMSLMKVQNASMHKVIDKEPISNSKITMHDKDSYAELKKIIIENLFNLQIIIDQISKTKDSSKKRTYKKLAKQWYISAFTLAHFPTTWSTRREFCKLTYKYKNNNKKYLLWTHIKWQFYNYCNSWFRLFIRAPFGRQPL